MRTEMEKVLSQQIQDAKTVADLNKTELDLTTTIENARQDLLDTFGDEGKTLELINDLTNSRLDTEKDIESVISDQVDVTEDVTDETEETLAANQELEEVLNEQVDISAEKSAIESEINDMTSEILANDELTTEEKIVQLQKMEQAFQVELNMLNAKIEGLKADHDRAVVAAQSMVLTEEAAQAEWDKANALRDQIASLKQQAAIVASAQTELQTKIGEQQAGARVGTALGGVGGARTRSTRDAERAERERQREADKAAKEAEKAEKARQKELDKAEKERIQQEKEHTQALKEAQDAQIEAIERETEARIEHENMLQERRMAELERAQEFAEEQRKIEEERIQRERELNAQLEQLREQQLGELRGIAEQSSKTISDIIQTLAPLTAEQQLRAEIEESRRVLGDFVEVIEDSTEDLAKEGQTKKDRIEELEDEQDKWERKINRRNDRIAEAQTEIADLTKEMNQFLQIAEMGEGGQLGIREISNLQQIFGTADPAYFRQRASSNKIAITELTNGIAFLEQEIVGYQQTLDPINTELEELTGVAQGMYAQFEANLETLAQAPIATIIKEQELLARELGFVANGFQGITDLIDGLFDQSTVQSAENYFNAVFLMAEVIKRDFGEEFPGMLEGFKLELDALNARIEELRQDPEASQELLNSAIANATQLEELIKILSGEMVDVNNELAQQNLEFIKGLIETESQAADAIAFIEGNLNRLNQERTEAQFASNKQRIINEIETNKEVLRKRLELLAQLKDEALQRILIGEGDPQELTDILNEIQTLTESLEDIEEIEIELVDEAGLQDIQEMIDKQSVLIDQQEQLGDISGLRALQQRLKLIEDEIKLAEERGDSEEEINELLIEQKGVQDEIFQKQIAGLQNIAKTSELVFEAVSQIDSISGMFEAGDTAGAVVGAGELTTKVGQALIGSKSQTLRTMGAVLLGVGIFSKIIGKIIDLVSGKEQTAEDIAKEHLKVVQILNNAAFDTASERLDFLRDQRQELIDQNEELGKSQEELLFDKQSAEENLKIWQNFYDRKDDIMDESNDKQKQFVNAINKVFGTAFDFGENIRKSDLEKVFKFINSMILEGEADLEDLDLIIGINEDIFGEELTLIENRIKTAEFKLKIATELEDPEAELLAQQDIINAYASSFNKALSDAEIPEQLTDLSTEGLLDFADTLTSIFGDEIPPNLIDSWNELFDAIKKTDEAEKESLQNALDEQEQLKLRQEAGKISAEEANKQILEILENQRKLIEEQIEAYGLTVELEMELLNIQIEINRMKNEGNEADSEANRILTDTLRKRQQLIESYRAQNQGAALSTEQLQQLKQTEQQIITQLRNSGASEDEIRKFIESLPAFEQGGLVPETGLAMVHEGEYVIPANQVREIEDQIKSFASIFANNNPTVTGTDAITQEFTRSMLQKEAQNVQQNLQFNTQFGNI
jgi:hypothetical protein